MFIEKEKEGMGKMKLDPSIKNQLLELKAKIDTLLDSCENVIPVKEEVAVKEDPIPNTPSTIPTTTTTKKTTSTMSKTALNASDMAELLGVASLESVGETKKEQQEVVIKSEDTKKLPQTPQSPTPSNQQSSIHAQQSTPSLAPQPSDGASQIATQPVPPPTPQMHYTSPIQQQQQQMMQQYYGSPMVDYNPAATAAYAAYYNNYQQPYHPQWSQC